VASAAAGAAVLRVAVDGPPAADPDGLADSLLEPLRVLGRPAAHVSAASFWRDASLRLEYGREDHDSFASWLDADALRREVLTPAAERGEYLPSLRDPVTNRSTREAPRQLGAGGVLLVSGALLLGRGLPFDRTVHLAMSAAARARHTSADASWTLPAYERYDAEVRPAGAADVVIRMDDRRHPAVGGLR
jgi:hypothetical protein